MAVNSCTGTPTRATSPRHREKCVTYGWKPSAMGTTSHNPITKPQYWYYKPKSVIRTAIFVVDFVTDWLQSFCNLIILMIAIKIIILQITYFQDITDLTTDSCTSNDRFGINEFCAGRSCGMQILSLMCSSILLFFYRFNKNRKHTMIGFIQSLTFYIAAFLNLIRTCS